MGSIEQCTLSLCVTVANFGNTRIKEHLDTLIFINMTTIELLLMSPGVNCLFFQDDHSPLQDGCENMG